MEASTERQMCHYLFLSFREILGGRETPSRLSQKPCSKRGLVESNDSQNGSVEYFVKGAQSPGFFFITSVSQI